MAFFIDSAGNVVEGPDDARTAAALGYTPATPEQVAAAQAQAARKAEFSTLPQQALGAVEALAKGATVGLSTPLQVMLGADPARIEARREELGGLGTALDIAGSVAPVLATGGTGLGARIAAATPAALVARGSTALAGRAAARAAPGAARTLAGDIAEAAIREGVQGGVEGTAYGVGQVIDEAALGDPELNAERALATVALSGVLGGALGGAFGGGVASVGKLAEKARKSQESAIKWFEDAYPAYGSRLTGAPEADIRFMMQNRDKLDVTPKTEDLLAGNYPEPVAPAPHTPREVPPEAIFMPRDVPAEGVYQKTPLPVEGTFVPREVPADATLGSPVPNPVTQKGKFAQFTAETTDRLRSVWDDTEAMAREASNSIRPSETAALVNENVNVLTARSEARRLAQEIDALAKQGRANGPDRFSPGAISQLEEIRDGLVRNAFGVLPEKADDATRAAIEAAVTPYDVFEAIDTAKNLLWKTRAQVSKVSPFAAETRGGILDMWKSVKLSLEDEKVWGEAGRRQAAYNDQISGWINDTKNILPKIAEKVERRGGEKVWEIVPSKVSKLLANADTIEGSTNVQRLMRWLDRGYALRTQIEASAKTTGREVSRESVEASAAGVREAVLAEQRLKAFRAEEIGRTRDAAQIRTAHAENEAAKREHAAAVAKAHKAEERLRKRQAKEAKEAFDADESARKQAFDELNQLHKDAVKARKEEIAASAKMMRNGARWNGFMDIIGAGAVGKNPLLAPLFVGYRAMKYIDAPDRLIRQFATIEKALKRQADFIESAIGAVVAGSPVKDAMRTAAASSIASVVGDSFDNDAEAVAALATNPELLADRMADGISDVDMVAPRTAAALRDATVRAVRFLSEKAPHPTQLSPLVPPMPPSKAQLAEFQVYVDAIENPLSILDMASRGTLTSKSVEAVQAVYPALMADMQASIFYALSQPDLSVPYRAQQQLSLVLGQDLTGTMKSLATNQTAYVVQPPAQKPKAPSASASKRLANSQRTATQASAID